MPMTVDDDDLQLGEMNLRIGHAILVSRSWWLR